MFKRIKTLHLVGIGGTGMCGIAEILLNLGYQVTGSDLQLTEVTARLARLGATIHQGHRAEHVGPDVNVVVISSAVGADNPEVVMARERKIPVIRRAEMLAELMRMKYGIGIAGTHGKTTTTSMTGQILAEGGLDPTVIVGGRVKALDANAKIGRGEYLVAEADEFDRSFLQLTPTIAVVTTIEAEHLDCYRDLAEIKDAFVSFCNKVPFYGAVIACLDEPSIQSVVPRIEKRLITYGFSSQADLRALDATYSRQRSAFTVHVHDQELGKLTLQVPGAHNVKNALAATAVALELGVPFDTVRRALEGFTGVHRRFEIKGEVGGVMVVDDYAHHPTEIQVTLQAAREGWGRRIVAIFQPHLYSRTRDFGEEFGRSFFHCDLLVVTDVYPAREAAIPGVTGELVARAARASGHKRVHYVPDRRAIPAAVLPELQPGDMVITFGAGDIWRAGEEILRALAEGRRARDGA
ncbi:MAG: UDP-N-acetylmuramate--L-alanine ligase [Deltaproteobacteria bacterium]|nr:UDP-N-acetylmuramate--L-alanine ligase [Deltaproteobacteria bacterium]MBI3078868.1 UDP-N-acetylmuramate--L-alanine ligase [Deltaproteobacteria bacterium]